MKRAQPHEARELPELPANDDMRFAFSNLLVAVNGVPYAGISATAIAYALRWLRAHPDQADVLLGRSSVEP